MKKVLNNYSSKNDVNIRQIIAYRDNVLEIEEYREGFTREDTMNVMSVTKSVTSLLVGIAIDKGYINYLDLVRITSYNPAKILGIDRGVIEEGKVADITIFDPNKEYIYEEDMIVSKSKNTPYILGDTGAPFSATFRVTGTGTLSSVGEQPTKAPLAISAKLK